MGDSKTDPSIVDEIFAFNRDRIPKLVRLKYRRMAQDPFAFFRGTDHLFATDWPRLKPPDSGPAILICGDLHLENFGGYRTVDGDFVYDINDFDEALVAPCSLDLVRCAASVLLAAQLWRFTPVQALRTLLVLIDRYRATVIKAQRTGRVGSIAVGTARGPIWKLLERPVHASEARFLKQFTEGNPQGKMRIERQSGRFRAVSRERVEQIRYAVESYGKDLGTGGRFHVRDVALRIAGTGSLGLERYAVLVREREQPRAIRILDVKEERPSALLACADAQPPGEHSSDAERVVRAQRQLQAQPPSFLDVLDVDGQMFRMRALIPVENRTGLDQLRRHPRRLRRATAVAGRLAGWAHVRGCGPAGPDRAASLSDWAAGPGLDAVIASAVRFAEQTRRNYRAFCIAAERWRR